MYDIGTSGGSKMLICTLWHSLAAILALKYLKLTHTYVCRHQSATVYLFAFKSNRQVFPICIFQLLCEPWCLTILWNRNWPHRLCISGSMGYLWRTYQTCSFWTTVRGGCFCYGFWITLEFWRQLHRKALPFLLQTPHTQIQEQSACF